MVNYIIRVIRFGLPSRAVAPFILGVCRLVWLGHLVPTQLQKLSHAGAELCSSGNIYLAQGGATVVATVILYLNLIRSRTASFLEVEDGSSSTNEIANQFQSTISQLISSIGMFDGSYSRHVVSLIYIINKQLNENCLNKLLIEFTQIKPDLMSIFSHLIYYSFSISSDDSTKPNQWVILTIPNIIQMDSLKKIIQICSVLFIATIRSETCESLLPIMDYKMSYDDVDDDVINQEDWTIFVQLGTDFLSQQTDSDASDFINSMKKLTEKKSMKPEDISRIYQIISSSKISSE